MRNHLTALFSLTILVSATSSIGADQPEPPEKPQPNLVRQVGHDFVDLFTTPQNAATMAIGGGAAWAFSSLDDNIASSNFNSNVGGSASLDSTFEAGEIIGSSPVQVGAAFAAYGIGKLTHKDGLERVGRDLVRAQILTQSLTAVLKAAISRERPDGSNDRSFPSGHTSGTFATATVLARHYGWKAGIPAYAFGTYVAASRVNEGKHYLSDVIFGATIGIMVGRSLSITVAAKKFAIEPMVVERGFGAQIRWVPLS